MTIDGTHPFIAAQIARYRADDLAREAADVRRARFTRRSRRGARTDDDFPLSAQARKIGAVRDRLLRMIGPTPLVRSLAGQSVLSAFGEGAFLTGSAVFFTVIVGLSAQQVGLGLSIAALARFVDVGAARADGRPGRRQADVAGHQRRRGRPVRRVAVPRGLLAVRRDDDRDERRRGRPAQRPRRLHDRGLPPRGAGALAGLHAGGPQRRLHPRCAGRRRRAGHGPRRGRPGGAAADGLPARPQRVVGLQAPRRDPRAVAGVRARGGRRARRREAQRPAQPGLLPDEHLQRRARHARRAAQRRHPAVAGAGDRRAARAARVAVRHQHGDGGRPAGGRGARRGRRTDGRSRRSTAARPASCSPAGSCSSPTTPSAG